MLKKSAIILARFEINANVNVINKIDISPISK